MVLMTPSGPQVGQPIWSCSTYPQCRGMAADDPPRAEQPASIDARPRWQTRRIGRAWLLVVGLMLVGISMMYLLAPALYGPR